MITEHRRHPFIPMFIGLMGGKRDDFSYTYKVPDFLNHAIEQPDGVTIYLEGNRDDLEATCEIDSKRYPFAALVPAGTIFSINDDPLESYSAHYNRRNVFIPSNLRHQRIEPVLSILHECGHVWHIEDRVWSERVSESVELLKTERWLPFRPGEKRRHLEAYRILGEEERRACSIEIYTIGRLRALGIDLTPHLRTSGALMGIINDNLATHERFGQNLQFDEAEVVDLLAGNLSIPVLGEIVVSHLDRTLPALCGINQCFIPHHFWQIDRRFVTNVVIY